MWTAEKQNRFDDLWKRRFESTLTETEEQELTLFLNELDSEEEERLRPAMEELEKNIEGGQKNLADVRMQNAMLEAIIAKRESLLARVRSQLAQFQAESQALQAEYETARKYSQASI
ncbi:MAG: hypothetical protein SF097_01760 [Acidobacteriota bacterium]|nr:hypothetical protein [Acidobacteriota bacterium]